MLLHLHSLHHYHHFLWQINADVSNFHWYQQFINVVICRGRINEYLKITQYRYSISMLIHVIKAFISMTECWNHKINVHSLQEPVDGGLQVTLTGVSTREWCVRRDLQGVFLSTGFAPIA